MIVDYESNYGTNIIIKTYLGNNLSQSRVAQPSLYSFTNRSKALSMGNSPIISLKPKLK